MGVWGERQRERDREREIDREKERGGGEWVVGGWVNSMIVPEHSLIS